MKREYVWQDQPTQQLADYAHAHAGGMGPAQHVTDMPQVFKDYAEQVIVKGLGYEVDHWVYWATVQDPISDPIDWMPKFPHNHGYDGITLVQFLEAPEQGGELVIFDNRWVVTQSVTPEPGLGALIVNHEIHGVRAVRGSKPRTVVIAGAYPFPHGSTKCRCAEDWEPVVA